MVQCRAGQLTTAGQPGPNTTPKRHLVTFSQGRREPSPRFAAAFFIDRPNPLRNRIDS